MYSKEYVKVFSKKKNMEELKYLTSFWRNTHKIQGQLLQLKTHLSALIHPSACLSSDRRYQRILITEIVFVLVHLPLRSMEVVCMGTFWARSALPPSLDTTGQSVYNRHHDKISDVIGSGSVIQHQIFIWVFMRV